MTEAEKKTLLICQGDRCKSSFECAVNPKLTGDAASLPAALQAHKEGWIVADGQILCPRCALKQKGQQVH